MSRPSSDQELLLSSAMTCAANSRKSAESRKRKRQCTPKENNDEEIRMTTALAEMKHLLIGSLKLKGEDYVDLNTEDILEMSERYMQNLQATTAQNRRLYNAGFTYCQTRARQFIQEAAAPEVRPNNNERLRSFPSAVEMPQNVSNASRMTPNIRLSYTRFPSKFEDAQIVPAVDTSRFQSESSTKLDIHHLPRNNANFISTHRRACRTLSNASSQASSVTCRTLSNASSQSSSVTNRALSNASSHSSSFSVVPTINLSVNHQQTINSNTLSSVKLCLEEQVVPIWQES